MSHPSALQAAPAALLQALDGIASMASGRRRLVVVMGQLGDFDSLEYAQALAGAQARLAEADITVAAFGIGSEAGAERFCRFTGLERSVLHPQPDNKLHQQLDLYAGLRAPGGPWPSLLLMCTGLGSPGTLAEVWRGYSGDRSAAPRFGDEQAIDLPGLGALKGGLFNRLGQGYQRPFELATVRLQNMVEVLGAWRTYVPDDAFLTQRGATYLLAEDNTLLYSHLEKGLLGFSATMSDPLGFLTPFLSEG